MVISDFIPLKNRLTGELHTDFTTRRLYATDASAYREIPIAVAIPKVEEDIQELIAFARTHHLSLIPRTAGTSLAGQVVGKGIVVDVSRHFTEILELNEKERWVRVQPGVIRDELNRFLKPHGLLFGPETSTANRAMIGGMIGNNSCGSNSIVYGSTRDHLLEVKGYLSDGTPVEFGPLQEPDFKAKTKLPGLEGKLYAHLDTVLSNPDNQQEIIKEFPKSSIKRRNTGYAIDLLLKSQPFGESQTPFNACTLIAGSEGTLLFITEAKLSLDPIPKGVKGLLCIHFHSITESLQGNLIALRYDPHASELMDHHILERTKDNISYRQNRFFIEGDPKALLVVELLGSDEDDLRNKTDQLIHDLQKNKLGYHYPLVTGDDMSKVWDLRKAGLGLLSNVPGDAKPAPVIEDTAVDVQDLPAYIEEFNAILDRYGLYCVHYAHAGSGELHLRPILNLKTQEGHRLFRTILDEIAHLVKKYKGSLSGEHGDGRLRGEFIPFMIGAKNYELLREIKSVWDPHNLFNPGKIVDTEPMDTSLRFEPDQQTREFPTMLNFDASQGYLRAAEQCNGSGDCRKTQQAGGTMCPSYMATRDEKDTTRARANILREVLTHSKKSNAFDSKSIKEVLDLCLSCKGCKAECPSNVDMSKLKAEFQYQYYKSNGIPLRTRLIANFSRLHQLASMFPRLYNTMIRSRLTAPLIKRFAGFAPKRSMPEVSEQTVRKWNRRRTAESKGFTKEVYLFCDEFTNFNDAQIGITAIRLLERLRVKVNLITHEESGRTFLSKGLLKQARRVANKNVTLFSELVTEEKPLIGIEPSAILSFRDEYPDLVDHELRDKAHGLAQNTLLIDEYLYRLAQDGHITPDMFTSKPQKIKLHGHCHQKALSQITTTHHILSLPEKYEVELIPSGCCGMAGAFGYEKEHFDISMQIAELILLPTVRLNSTDTLFAVTGTSCRHQIKDGTGKRAYHPVEILFDALLLV